MSSGYQCGRCGTRYGIIVLLAARGGISNALMRDSRLWRWGRCYTHECPATPRALLWRMFGWRGGPATGWRPSLIHGLRSLRRGDPLYED